MSTPDLSDASGPAARSVAPEHSDDAGSGVPAAGVIRVVNLAGAATGHVAGSRAANAGMVAKAIESTHTRRAAQAASRSSFLQETAAKVQVGMERAARKGTRAGGREQLKGHFIERLDVSTYNAKARLTGKKLVSSPDSRNPGYDAYRFVKGKFAGGVQQKSSAAGTEKAIAQIEKAKPGSACRAMLRVPKDQAAKAHDCAAGRIHVSEMEFTSAQAGKKLDQGIGNLAKRGAKATSTARAVGKSAGVGAVVSLALGAAGDARALKRGDMSGRDFAENRCLDAAEGAANAVVGMSAMAAGGMAATAALGPPAVAAVATSAGAAGTAALGAVGGMGAAGAAVAGALGSVTVAAAAPFVIGTAAAMGTGIVVSKGFNLVRKSLQTSQHERAARADGESALAFAAA